LVEQQEEKDYSYSLELELELEFVLIVYEVKEDPTWEKMGERSDESREVLMSREGG